MIWVIAGTKSARDVIGSLAGRGFRIIATTATEYGAGLIMPHEGVTVIPGRLDAVGMISCIRDYGVRVVVDASHPYSLEVSRNAVEAAACMGIPCIRFERKQVDYRGVKTFRGFEEAARNLDDKQGNVLLTIGSRNLGYFRGHEGMTIFARVLPMIDSLRACEMSGFTADRIIAMRFPFSKKLSSALYDELAIRFLVTKESGEEGGVGEKIRAALETGIEVMMIERPERPAMEVFFDRALLINRVEEIIRG